MAEGEVAGTVESFVSAKGVGCVEVEGFALPLCVHREKVMNDRRQVLADGDRVALVLENVPPSPRATRVETLQV